MCDDESSLLSCLIPVIHELRRDVLADNPDLSVDEEVSELLRCTTQLEKLVSSYDDLAVVKSLKSIISSYVDLDARDSEGDEISMAKITHKQGLDPVRTRMAEILADAQRRLASDQLLRTRRSPEVCNKKQRSDDLFASFNFDDLPMFEPLETTLSLLREDPTSAVGVQKLLSIELGELQEHPQWTELVPLLYRGLCLSKDSSSSMLLSVHIRLAEGLMGQQCADVLLNLLKHWWLQWGAYSEDPADFSTSLEVDRSSFSRETQLNIAAFLFVLQSTRTQVETSDQSYEAVLVQILLLIAHGRVPVGFQGQQLDQKVSLIDALAELSAPKFASISFVRSFKAVTVFNHAVHSGLLPSLNLRLRNLLSSDVSAYSLPDACRVRRLCLHLSIFLDVVTLYGASKDGVLQMLSNTTFVTPSWDQRLEDGSKAARPTAVDGVILQPMSDFNRMCSQLSGACSVLGAFTDPDRNGRSDGEQALNALLASAARNLRDLVSVAPEASVDVAPPVLEKLLCFAVHSPTSEKIRMLPTVWSTGISIIDRRGASTAHLTLLCALVGRLGTLLRLTGSSSSISQEVVELWSTVTSEAMHWLSGNDEESGEQTGQSRALVTELSQMLLSSWNSILLRMRRVARNPDEVSSLDPFGAAAASGAQMMAAHAMECLQTLYLDSASSSRYMSPSSAHLMGVLTTLVTISTDKALLELIIPEQARDVLLGALVSCISAAFDDTHLTASADVVRDSGVISGIVAVMHVNGRESDLHEDVVAALVRFVSVRTEKVGAREDSECWEGQSEISMVLELLCGLAFIGRYHDVFSLMCASWPTLAKLCETEGVHSLQQLLSHPEGYLEEAAGEPWYVSLLRVGQVALSDISFCTHTRACRDALSLPYSVAPTAPPCDIESFFCRVVLARLTRAAPAFQGGCPFFLPFSEAELDNVAFWISREPVNSSEDYIDAAKVPIVNSESFCEVFSAPTAIFSVLQEQLKNTQVDAADDDQTMLRSPALHRAAVSLLEGHSPEHGPGSTSSLLRLHLVGGGGSEPTPQVSWFVGACHLIGIKSWAQLNHMLSIIGFSDESEVLAAVKTRASAVVLRSGSGALDVLSQNGLGVDMLQAWILKQWLFPFLHPQDLLLVTASLFSAAGGSEAGSHRGVRRVALVVAALTVRIAASVRDLCVPCSAYSCTGTEAIVRIMCAASYRKERIAPGSGLLATMVELGEL